MHMSTLEAVLAAVPREVWGIYCTKDTVNYQTRGLCTPHVMHNASIRRRASADAEVQFKTRTWHKHAKAK